MLHCFHQTLTDDAFSQEMEVTFPGCDPSRQAKLSTLLGFAVAAASGDYEARDLGYEKLRAMRQVFLLSRLLLTIHRTPQLGEILTVASGEVLVSARSQWILVDPESRKILRPSSFTAREFHQADLPLDCPECDKLLPPRQQLEELGEHRVVWSDLDGNGHIYSGNYGAIFWDNLPAELQTKACREFSINYHKEATLGEALTLTGCREENGYRMAGTGNGELCFTARCRFA